MSKKRKAPIHLRTPQDAMLILSALVEVQAGPELMRSYTEAIRLWFECWQASDPATRDNVVKLNKRAQSRCVITRARCKMGRAGSLPTSSHRSPDRIPRCPEREGFID